MKPFLPFPVFCLLSTLLASSAFAGGAWRSVGPGGGGWIESIKFSRHAPKRLLIGCDVGGFYCSEDLGRRYEMRNNGLKDLFVEDIAEHPTDPDTLLLATHGVYKTTDRGRTWVEKRAGFPPPAQHSYSIWISKIVYNERDPSEVYATVGWPRNSSRCKAKERLYLSKDGGESWRAVQTEGLPEGAYFNDFAVHPHDFRKLLAATPVGVFASRDGGAHWVQATGIPAPVQRLAQSSVRPGVVYATVHTVGGREPWAGGVYRSDDGGKTFVERNGGLSQRPGQPGCLDMMADGYDRILVDPQNPDCALLAGSTWWMPGIFATADGGKSWERLAPKGLRRAPGDGWCGTPTSPGATSFARSPFKPEVLAVGTGFAVYISADGGKTWYPRYTRDLKDGRYASTGLETTCVREIVPDRFQKGRFHFAYLDIGAWTTDDYGKTMRATFVNDNHSCWALAQSPTEPNLFWQRNGSHGPHKTSFDRFLVSHDGCRTWERVMAEDYPFMRSKPRSLVCLSTCAPYRLACCCAGGVAVSDDGGAHWAQLESSVLPDVGRVWRLELAAGVLYAPTLASDSEGGALWASDDGARTWRKLPIPPCGGVGDVAAEGDAVFFTAGYSYLKDLAATTPGGAYLSEDRGKTWRRVHEGRGCRAVAFSKGRLLLGFGFDSFFDGYAVGGVYLSDDRGESWQSLNDESLANPTINDIAVDPFDPDAIWVATHGNSIFTRQLPKK